MKIQGVPAEFPTYELTIIGEDHKAIAETAEGYVGLGHMETYKLQFNNASNERIVAKTSIDGKPVGDFVIHSRATVTIERPVDAQQLFTFVKSDSKQGKAAGVKNIAEDMRGLVTVTFVPEKKRDYSLRSDEFEHILRRGLSGGNHTFGGGLATKGMTTRGGGADFKEGITGLTGRSDQRFNTISMDLDNARAVTLNLRLGFDKARKAEPEIRPLGATAPSAPVPPPFGKRSPT